jgi:hypothetical protein
MKPICSNFVISLMRFAAYYRFSFGYYFVIRGENLFEITFHFSEVFIQKEMLLNAKRDTIRSTRESKSTDFWARWFGRRTDRQYINWLFYSKNAILQTQNILFHKKISGYSLTSRLVHYQLTRVVLRL